MDKGRRRAGGGGVQVRARQNMEERLKTMEEINNKNVLKMQQSHRIQAKVYEKMLSEQEQFWKEQLAEKEDQIGQMEAEIDEWRSRELVLVGEMEALEQRANEGSTTLSQNFMEAHQQLADAMLSLQRMKDSMEDKKKKKERRHRKEREREERLQRSRPSEEESESEGDAPQDSSLHFKSSGGGGGGFSSRMHGSVDHDWKRQVAQLDGKWSQIKDVMEAMREEMEQKSMLGSAALRQSFGEACEHLSDCMDLMERVKHELEEQARRRRKEHRPGNKDSFWKRWYRRLQTTMGMGTETANQIAGVGITTANQIGGQMADHVAHWTGLGAATGGGLKGPGGGGWGGQSPARRTSPRRHSPAGGGRGGGRRSPVARLGRSRSRQQQRDDL